MCHHWIDDRVSEAEFEELIEEDPEAEEPEPEPVEVAPTDDD